MTKPKTYYLNFEDLLDAVELLMRKRGLLPSLGYIELVITAERRVLGDAVVRATVHIHEAK